MRNQEASPIPNRETRVPETRAPPAVSRSQKTKPRASRKRRARANRKNRASRLQHRTADPPRSKSVRRKRNDFAAARGMTVRDRFTYLVIAAKSAFTSGHCSNNQERLFPRRDCFRQRRVW